MPQLEILLAGGSKEGFEKGPRSVVEVARGVGGLIVSPR